MAACSCGVYDMRDGTRRLLPRSWKRSSAGFDEEDDHRVIPRHGSTSAHVVLERGQTRDVAAAFASPTVMAPVGVWLDATANRGMNESDARGANSSFTWCRAEKFRPVHTCVRATPRKISFPDAPVSSRRLCIRFSSRGRDAEARLAHHMSTYHSTAQQLADQKEGVEYGLRSGDGDPCFAAERFQCLGDDAHDRSSPTYPSRERGFVSCMHLDAQKTLFDPWPPPGWAPPPRCYCSHLSTHKPARQEVACWARQPNVRGLMLALADDDPGWQASPELSWCWSRCRTPASVARRPFTSHMPATRSSSQQHLHCNRIGKEGVSSIGFPGACWPWALQIMRRLNAVDVHESSFNASRPRKEVLLPGQLASLRRLLVAGCSVSSNRFGRLPPRRAVRLAFQVRLSLHSRISPPRRLPDLIHRQRRQQVLLACARAPVGCLEDTAKVNARPRAHTAGPASVVRPRTGPMGLPVQYIGIDNTGASVLTLQQLVTVPSKVAVDLISECTRTDTTAGQRAPAHYCPSVRGRTLAQLGQAASKLPPPKQTRDPARPLSSRLHHSPLRNLFPSIAVAIGDCPPVLALLLSSLLKGCSPPSPLSLSHRSVAELSMVMASAAAPASGQTEQRRRQIC
nr:unnamed protein product [Digitaria exilis]